MKNILLIGVGGTGSNAVDVLYQQIKEFGNQTENHVSALVFDTDVGSASTISCATVVPMSDNSSVGTICDRIGSKYLRGWFPCDDKSVRAQELVRGAAQWRKKSFLAFLNLMNKPVARATFIGALEKMVADPRAACEIYVIASIAGGTGSGSFIPIALYAKQYLRRNLGREPIVNAMIALPDIYAAKQTPDNRIKVYSNAYAILRELNAINLVAHNYNSDENLDKKAPVKLCIGHPDEPNVGVLFDSDDPRYWTPEAAPFDQVFILDRIPGLNSIVAHDIVMANSLYTLICTEIGAEFDSEASNHAILHSQNNGSNAIYAGISTSQIRFPSETVLDYLARQKAMAACEDEWMVLHRETEKKIKEKIQIARDSNDKYVMRDGEYAKLVMDQLEELEKNGNGVKIVDMVDRGTAIYNEGKKEPGTNTVTKFFMTIDGEIFKRIPERNPTFSEVKKASDKRTVFENGIDSYGEMRKYFKICVEQIKRSSKSLAESILSLDDTRCVNTESPISLVDNILCKKTSGKKKQFIHPVAAMVQLCRFKYALHDALTEVNDDPWDELSKRDYSIRNEFLEFSDDEEPYDGDNCTPKHSAYAHASNANTRFLDFFVNGDENEYQKKRTDARCDEAVLEHDVLTIFAHIHDRAVDQLRYVVYSTLSKNVDILIEKYRNFFARFEKEKDGLEEETKTLIGKDAGIVDSVINVYCSEADKMAILKEVFDNSGPESDAQVAETDDISGRGVFNAAYHAAVAEHKKDESWNDKDTTAYHSLFDSLIQAYHDYIGRTDAFQKISSYNVVQAIEASAKSTDQLDKALKTSFATAQELAEPSLRYNAENDESDLVMPTKITVFMMSLNTAKYIKRFAERFDLHLPADRNKEINVIRSCAEEFISKYSGSDTARVSIVDSMPDNVLYCTGEVMDITPLRIDKFNECSADNTYFKQYNEALRRFAKFGTDMWNPHLGNNFHSRGYLPYMNPKMEDECDKKMVKALIWGLFNGKITYSRSGLTYDNGQLAFRYSAKGGKKAFVMGTDGNVVRMKNVAQLMVWLRNNDELIEAWSEGFDKDLKAQLNALPNIADDASEIGILEAAITKSDYMKFLQTTLFKDPSFEDGEAGPGLLELAYKVKTSEETARDCDDAERILSVAYDIFMQFTSFRASRESKQERFIQIYTQQLEKLFEGFASASIFRRSSQSANVNNSQAYYKQIIGWLNDAGYFLGIPTESAINDRCEVCINKQFSLSEYPTVDRILKNNRVARSRAEVGSDVATLVDGENSN